MVGIGSGVLGFVGNGEKNFLQKITNLKIEYFCYECSSIPNHSSIGRKSSSLPNDSIFRTIGYLTMDGSPFPS